MWGCNPDARLYMNTKNSQLSPVRIHLPGKAIDLSLGVSHSGVITDDGSLYMAGLGEEG